MSSDKSPTSASPAALDIEVVRTLGKLASHGDAWNQLAARCPAQLPMVSYAWTSTYLEKAMPAGTDWACFFAYRGADLVAVLPVIAQRASRFGLRGQVVKTPRDDHTGIGDLLFCSLADVDGAARILSAVSREFPLAGYVEITRFPANSLLLEALRGSLLNFRHTCREERPGAYLPVPVDFAKFRNGLSRNFRNNLNKAGNKISELPDVAFRFTDGQIAAEEIFAEFLKVEASGWKGEEGSAIGKSGQWIEFYRTLVQRLREAGWLEWQLLVGDGNTLAANLAIRMPGAVIIWKLGYNEEYSRCSPGSILLEELVRREATTLASTEINLTTSQPWYDNWGMRYRNYYTARFYYGWRGWLLWYLPDKAKDLLRRMPLVMRIKGWLRD